MHFKKSSELHILNNLILTITVHWALLVCLLSDEETEVWRGRSVTSTILVQLTMFFPTFPLNN